MNILRYKDIEVIIEDAVEGKTQDSRVLIYKQGDEIDKSLFEQAVCKDVNAELEELEDKYRVKSGYVIIIVE